MHRFRTLSVHLAAAHRGLPFPACHGGEGPGRPRESGLLPDRPRRQNDAISLNALVLAALQDRFDSTLFINEGTSQAEAGRPALAKTPFDQPALSREQLRR